MACKGKCNSMKAGVGSRIDGSIYASGLKRCNVCDCYFKVESIWCPCCGWRLRLKPKGAKWKRIYRETMANSK